MPSCCLTCSDCSEALSCAMFASTRLPMPVVSVSDRFWANVDWIENFAAPADNLARAALTLVSEDWIVATKVEALDWVEMEAVEAKVTTEPDRLIFWACEVMRRVPSADA